MQRVLVIRNDKLGDFMLAWPALAVLNAALMRRASLQPNLTPHISVLVPHYTAPMAKLCPSVDEVIIDPVDSSRQASEQATESLIALLKIKQFDTVIVLFSDAYNARIVRRLGIANRVAPATKWVQIFYNQRLRQKRSESAKPEWRYNVELVQFALAKQGFPAPDIQAALDQIEPPYLRFPSDVVTTTRVQLAQSLDIDPTDLWIMVHPGSGGSARNLVLAQYAQFLNTLMTTLSEHHAVPALATLQVIVTAGPQEEPVAEQLAQALASKGLKSVVLSRAGGLASFATAISTAQLFVASSTGPLHIAGALDVPTVGVFTARRSAKALRWQPLNQTGRHFAISVPHDAQDPENLSLIDWPAQAVLVAQWFATLINASATQRP